MSQNLASFDFGFTQTPDDTQSIMVDTSFIGEPLLLCFGGHAGQKGCAPFEFVESTKSIPVNKIYIRDLNQLWYHAGLPNITDNLCGTVDFLMDRICQAKPSKIITLGNSMGGYAAITFGAMLAADQIHAFAPHTHLQWGHAIRNGERQRLLKSTYPKTYFDSKWVIRNRFYDRPIHLYFDPYERLDTAHIYHLSSIPNVHLHTYPRSGHLVVRKLRDNGRLRQIIQCAVDH